MAPLNKIKFGIIGCGLMGREFASAAARWFHLQNINVVPEIVAVCDSNKEASAWFEKNVETVKYCTTDYRELLRDHSIDAIYCAVPHHLHEQFYTDIIHAGKHLLGEKPFGIDQQANANILEAIHRHPELVVRCSSEFPFFPGAYQLFTLIKEGFVGRIVDVEAGFWHSSDLNPHKKINWKRQIKTNGEYGCMGDLGMHVLHLPLRFGWKPTSVRALLSQLITKRPNEVGELVNCDTWDNAILSCEAEADGHSFPMILSMKRIAPGHANTWFIRARGLQGSVEFSTQNPKQLITMQYTPGKDQVWNVVDVPYKSAYSAITGGIFEFGFSDSVLQMYAAFCDEIANGRTTQPLHCATPEEAKMSHDLFTAALQSYKTGQTVQL